MGRKAKQAPPPGGLVICRKPAGPTSIQILSRLRRASGIRKAGHCGTLDPFADGVLPIAFGRATNMIRYMDDYDKVYRVLLHLGETTDTQDISGRKTGGLRPSRARAEAILADGAAEVLRAAAELTGEITQETPQFSAAKVDGRPMYDYARKGEKVQGKLRRVEIYSAEFIGFGLGETEAGEKVLSAEEIPGKAYFPELSEEKGPDREIELPPPALWLVFDVHCSKGTYIRTWVHDLGQKLGTGAYAARLRRLRSGPFSFEEAYPPEKIEKAFASASEKERAEDFLPLMRGAETARPDFPVIELEKTDAVCLLQGKTLRLGRDRLPAGAKSRFRVFSEGTFLGIAKALRGEGQGLIAAERMFTDIENFASRSD